MITTVVSPPASSPPVTDGKPVYNLVIIYENATTGKRANHFCEQLIQELGEATLGIKDLWSFRVLDIPHVRRSAAEAAAMADVVILALDGHDDLPDGIKTWVEQWGGQVAARPVAQSPILIALFGAADDKQKSVGSMRTFLGAIAETAGLTFLHTLRQPTVEDQRAA
jgi:hypothetical protein